MTAPTRRRLIASLAAFAAGPVRARPAEQPGLEFAILRNGGLIGRHRVVFRREGEALHASAEVQMVIHLGPVPIFRYLHRSDERWRDGAFEALVADTASNGRRQHVVASRVGDAVRIEAGGAPVMAPASAVPLTHWNPEVLGRPLFNPQTGRLLRIAAAARHHVPLPLPLVGSGELWSLRGEAEIDDWYDGEGRWAALQAHLPDGSQLEYRRQS